MSGVEKTVATIKGIPTKEELEALMKEMVVIVTFNKLDGEERTMAMTHCLELIPEDKRPKTQSEPHPKNVTGWCGPAEGWRSCRYDRIKSVIYDPSNVSEIFSEMILEDELKKQ